MVSADFLHIPDKRFPDLTDKQDKQLNVCVCVRCEFLTHVWHRECPGVGPAEEISA